MSRLDAASVANDDQGTLARFLDGIKEDHRHAGTQSISAAGPASLQEVIEKMVVGTEAKAETFRRLAEEVADTARPRSGATVK